MKFYRVRYRCEGGNSAGFSWHTSHGDASRAVAEAIQNDPEEYKTGGPEVEAIEIVASKTGILAALEHYASHPDNG